MANLSQRKIEVIILRGAPGSGKTTLAKYLQRRKYLQLDWEIVSADDYFTDVNGVYNFVASELQRAHDKCLRQFHAFTSAGKNVIIDNTNRRHHEFARFSGVPGASYRLYRVVSAYQSSKPIPRRVMDIHMNEYETHPRDTCVRLATAPNGDQEFLLKRK